MMNRLFAAGALASALIATGCAGPMMAGAPGQVRQVAPAGTPAASPEDPSLCVADISANFYTFLTNVSPFRSFRLLTREHPEPSGCDLILKFVHPGSTVFSRDQISAFSAYSGELAWQGVSAGAPGKYGAQFLLEQLIRDFWPGQPARAKLTQEKASGRRVAKADLDRAGYVLRSESELNARMRRLVVEAAEQSLAAPSLTVAAAPAASTPLPAALASVRSDLDVLPAARASSPRRHAVIVGVERYRENLPRADFASGDARLAAEYFKRVLGVPEQNLALLLDDRAAKSDFEKYFERWLPNRVEAGDEVFVYFSGHGAPNPAKGDAYLVPYDGDPTYIAQTGYSLDRLYAQLAKLPAKSVVVAMDSCFSGAGGRSVLAKGARPLVSVVTNEHVPAKITVLAASAGDQTSNTYQEMGHGLFTYYLLKGMKEKGDDLKAVFDYLKPEVARAARRELNADQDPQWRQGR